MAVAQLGLAIDSRQAAQAAVDLDALNTAAGKAEKGASSLGREVREISGSLTAMVAILRNVERNTEMMARASAQASASINVTAAAADKMAVEQREAAGATTSATAALTAEATAARATATAIEQVNVAVAQTGRITPSATAELDRHTRAMNDNAKVSRDLAFQRRNLSFQLFDISQSLALGMPPLMIALQQGPQIAQIWGASEGGIGRAFAETAAMVGRFTVAALPAAVAVGAVALAFAGLTHDINQAGAAQVTFWDTLVATAEVSSEAILRALDPVWIGIQNGFTRAWDLIQPTLKTIGNATIAAFVGAYEHIRFLFGNNGEGLGNIIGAGVIGGVNLAIDAINKLVQGAVQGINEIIKIANSLGANIGEFGAGGLIPRLENPALKNAQRLTSERDSNISEAFNTDYLGGAFDAIADRAREVSQRPSKEEQERSDRLLKAQEEALARRVEMHKQALMTEEEQEIQSHERRMEDLTAFYEQGKMSLQEYQEWSQKAQEQHSERMSEIAQQQVERETAIRTQLLNATASIFGSISTIMEQSGQKNFAAAKAFGIAEAVINVATGITEALKLPFPLNWAQAAAVGAAGAAQIATIASARPGSSRQPSVNGGGASGTAAAPVEQPKPQQAMYVNIVGDMVPRQTVEDFVRLINEAAADGHKIILG